MLTMPPPRKKVPEAQLTLSPLFAHSRGMVSPVETARALGITDQQVRDLVEAGLLKAISIGDKPAKRDHIRIIRSSVEAMFLERYLEKNGEEFPLLNSAEVAAMRQTIKEQKLKS